METGYQSLPISAWEPSIWPPQTHAVFFAEALLNVSLANTGSGLPQSYQITGGQINGSQLNHVLKNPLKALLCVM